MSKDRTLFLPFDHEFQSFICLLYDLSGQDQYLVRQSEALHRFTFASSTTTSHHHHYRHQHSSDRRRLTARTTRRCDAFYLSSLLHLHTVKDIIIPITHHPSPSPSTFYHLPSTFKASSHCRLSSDLKTPATITTGISSLPKFTDVRPEHSDLLVERKWCARVSARHGEDQEDSLGEA